MLYQVHFAMNSNYSIIQQEGYYYFLSVLFLVLFLFIFLNDKRVCVRNNPLVDSQPIQKYHI
jgi:hypothetical protein